jgi:GH15 family glucan-1,4-alpha-glucosidase
MSKVGSDRIPRIEQFALIGDCETAALVASDGCIDWLCWPRFDSDACFAGLLGDREHGHWRIGPAGGARSERTYRGDTLILETTFETPEGTVRLVDFMPPRGKASDVVRLVEGVRGRVRMRMELTIRFGYGRVVPWVTRLADGSLRAIGGPDMVVLRTPVEVRGQDKATLAEFEVGEGEIVPFVLTYGPSHEPLPDAIDPIAALEATEDFWSDWASRCRSDKLTNDASVPPHWTAAIRRSLITLKALTYAPTGGIVAAPTTSLPEWIGGARNWDYRFCWLRDSAITLLALMNGGYRDEAEAWRDWLVRALAGSVEQIQIMYGLAGERRLQEWQADWLPGFAGSRPVRIGNAAHDQLQLDVYGEVMSLLHEARVGGIPESPEAWHLQRAMLRQLETLWTEPDEGIWEIRGPRRHFTFSKVMAWAAFDFCIRSAEQFGLEDSPVEHWRNVRDAIHADICERGYDAELGAFVQSYGSKELDASLLLLPQLHFLAGDDPRVQGTIAAIERELLVDGFVQRYRVSGGVDGLECPEGAFLACSFWLVSAFVSCGRLDDAVRLYDSLLDLRNDVGLLAEEYDPVARRQLGNFPQAFSHVALVDAGHRLAVALRCAEASAGEAPAPEARQAFHPGQEAQVKPAA